MIGPVFAWPVGASVAIQAGADGGSTPRGWWEYAVVAAAAAVVALALAWLFVGFLRRGEEDPGHIKHTILTERAYRGADGDGHDEA